MTFRTCRGAWLLKHCQHGMSTVMLQLASRWEAHIWGGHAFVLILVAVVFGALISVQGAVSLRVNAAPCLGPQTLSANLRELHA